MKSLAFKLFMFILSRLTGTGWGQAPPIKFAYKYMRRLLLPTADAEFNIHGLRMYQHGRSDYRDSDETLFTDGYERTETQYFSEAIKVGMTVVDIGANIGYYTLLACRKVGEIGKVLAYEPEPSNYQLLVKNVEANRFNNAVLLQNAVSNKAGEVKIYLSPKGHGEHSMYGADGNLGCFSVEAVSLDNSLNGQQIDVVKIDIEGAELSALVGMRETIKRNSDLKLFIEFCPSHFKRAGYAPKELWDKLSEYGFAYIYILNDKKRKLELGDCEDTVKRCGHGSVNLFCVKHPLEDMLTKRQCKVVLLGAYPPPYGGVSVHVKRLKEKLDRIGIPCIVHSYKGLSKGDDGVIYVGNRIKWFFSQLLSKNDGIVHCHGYSPLALASVSILALLRRKRVVVTTHGFLFESKKVALWHRFAFWLASVAKVYFVVTSPQVRERLLSLGVKPQNMTRDIVPAFIPPNLNGHEVIPSYVQMFINNHHPIIGANAYKIVFFKGIDLYGLDMCVELCSKLLADYPNIGLVFALPDIGDNRYLDKIKKMIAIKCLENSVLFVREPCEFYPILKNCDVFVRPTSVDDYGVSVAEAVYLCVPAVASDVCLRTRGTVLFKSRDINDFTNKVWDVLHNYDCYRDRINGIKFPDTVGELVEVYRGLSNV